MKLKLDGWGLGITFSACHFLPGHDKCNRLHGHNYAVHLELDGEPKDDGVVHDFVVLKSAMKEIASELDHCVLVPGKADDVDVAVEKDRIIVGYGNKSYTFPAEDVNILDIRAVSAEMLAAYILDKILALLELTPNITKISVGVDEGKGQGAWAWKEL
jgi:6-pyruvoyltetrahydropterin/6-carboxytetrahydropterin synthase